jgi:hypothetical protein
MKNKTDLKALIPYICYVLFAVLASFIETGNWIFTGLAFLLSGVFAFLAGKEEKDLREKAEMSRAASAFASAYIKSWPLYKDSAQTFDQTSSLLGSAALSLSGREASQDASFLLSLPLGGLKEALEHSLKENKPVLPAASSLAEHARKEAEAGLTALDGLNSTFLWSGIFLTLFPAVKIIFGNKLIDYKDPVFSSVFIALASLPLLLIYLGLFLRRKKHE